MKDILKKMNGRHVGRPSNKELKKRMTIKIIIVLIAVLSLGGGLYLYINRDFITFSSIFGNSSAYNEDIMKMQTDNSIKLVTFNPDKKKKVSSSLYFLQYYHTDGSNIFDYYFDKAGHDAGKYVRDRVEVYYNGKYITTFKRNSKYFYVKQNWAGKTVVLKTVGVYSGNRKVSKYVKVYIPSTLKLSTLKVNNKYYYIVNNSSAFYKYEKKQKFYQEPNSDWYDSTLGFAMVYANAIKINDFSITKNQPGLINGNNPRLSKVSFKGGTSYNKTKVVKAIYKQIAKNNPVVLQVNGNVDGTIRHYVVVIGYKVDFDYNNMNEKDLLILDVWDGQLEQMNGKGGSNGVDELKSRFMVSGADTGRDYGYQIYTLS